LFGYTRKSDSKTSRDTAQTIESCYPEDILEIVEMEAATKEFAALHPDAIYWMGL
jgi:hypothetical protein